MSISTHYAHQNSHKFGVTADDQQAQNDFKSLSTDLDSNDIAGAQKDFAAFLNDAAKAKIDLTGAQGQTADQSTALSTLSTSLQSGDVTSAKTALSSLNQTLKAHHHHRHHHSSDSSTGGASAPEGFSCDAQADSTQINSDLQKLSSALQTGDVTTAQQALIQLQKDDPKLASVSSASAATPAVVSV